MKNKITIKHINYKPEDNLVQLIQVLVKMDKKMKLNPELCNIKDLGSVIVAVNNFGKKVTL